MSSVETERRFVIKPLAYDDIREAAPAAVAKLIQSGSDARSLYIVVQRLAAMLDRSTPAIDHLGTLLVSWEAHEVGGELQDDDAYWHAIAEDCSDGHQDIIELDSLQLGCGEVLLHAIGDAARAHVTPEKESQEVHK